MTLKIDQYKLFALKKRRRNEEQKKNEQNPRICSILKDNLYVLEKIVYAASAAAWNVLYMPVRSIGLKLASSPIFICISV